MRGCRPAGDATHSVRCCCGIDGIDGIDGIAGIDGIDGIAFTAGRSDGSQNGRRRPDGLRRSVDVGSCGGAGRRICTWVIGGSFRAAAALLDVAADTKDARPQAPESNRRNDQGLTPATGSTGTPTGP